MNYPIVITPLSEDDGGGFMGYAPDLPGCMSDGPTPLIAFRRTMKVVGEWVAHYKRVGRQIPPPGSMVAMMEAERADLKRRLDEAMKSFDVLDDRVEALARDIAAINERLDHAERWTRFGDIAGLPVPVISPPPRTRARSVS